ncbi:hypothetical protein INS49_005532 [Diaporthe citri]|uniref:uncharacterized protein n=1 Tax=Diaporthe citri TaxID=83186 RepID=UPI001C81F550|nr:uncharacterized protein INS49_005532 [Diaporthe citri]KAG6353570.1 hypothetical protein INS49_005532 [Diaporthe citri]
MSPVLQEQARLCVFSTSADGEAKEAICCTICCTSGSSSSSPITATTPRSQSQSQSQSHDSQRRRHATTTPSPVSMMQPKPTGYAPDGIEDLSGAGLSVGLENSHPGPDGVYGGDMVLGAEDDSLRGPYPAAILKDRPEATSFANDGFFSGSPVSTQSQPRLRPSPLTTLVSLDPQFGTHQGRSSSDGDQTRNQAGHCYLAILKRLAQLEAALDAGPTPPRRDPISRTRHKGAQGTDLFLSRPWTSRSRHGGQPGSHGETRMRQCAKGHAPELFDCDTATVGLSVDHYTFKHYHS